MQKTIYETGKPLTSCECNFENLFANWGPRFVSNYDSLKLISWSFVETLTDTSRIVFYTRKIMDMKSVFSKSIGKGYSYQDGDTLRQINEFRIYPFFLKPPPDIPKEVALEEIWKLQQYLRELLHIGDKVFTVKFKYADTEYTFAVVCRPGENRIIFDKMGFMGIKDLLSN